MIAYAESLDMLVREKLPFGDVMSLGGGEAVLMTWYRNNVVHRLALPALIACLTINRRRPLEPTRLARMVDTVYPYLAAELYIGTDEPIETAVARSVATLVELGLLTRNADGALQAPPQDQQAYLRLGFVAEVVMQILERFFIVIVILEKAGPNGLDRTALEEQCQAVARRVARLHGVNAPEFFDARLFHGFVDTLIERRAIAAEGERIYFQPLVGEVIRAAGTVLPVAFRNAVLRARIQVTAPTPERDGSVDAAA
jgi:glycerol-3-phosphate O-acyltransferase